MSAGSELVGNALCLDFANTVDARPAPVRDDLSAAAPAWTWAAAAGLRPVPAACPGDERGLERLRALRQAVWHAFDAIVDGEPLPPTTILTLASAQAAALPRARWEVDGGAARPLWPPASRLLDLADPIADSAVHLLRSGPLDRVGRCPACRWLFLDTSRRGGRRWCSMATCGSRHKTAAHAARSRTAAIPRPPD